MSELSEKAATLHAEGCNCCQAVIGALCEGEGVSRSDAMRVGAAFGGGMRRGEVCGAVAGALMAIGLRHGAREPSQKDRKADTDARTAAYMKAFKERHGSYLCRELLQAAGKKVCPAMVVGAVELFEELEDGGAAGQ